jgi:hypothetical protein
MRDLLVLLQITTVMVCKQNFIILDTALMLKYVLIIFFVIVFPTATTQI